MNPGNHQQINTIDERGRPRSDLPVAGLNPGFFYTDSDYNDVRLDLSNVAGSSVLPAVTPEPGTFVLLGTGLAGGFATVRRRFHRL